MKDFKILINQKLDIDVMENPNGLPFVEVTCRDQSNNKITGWICINKEQLEEVVRELQVKLAFL